jgi:hypothetical protein
MLGDGAPFNLRVVIICVIKETEYSSPEASNFLLFQNAETNSSLHLSELFSLLLTAERQSEFIGFSF